MFERWGGLTPWFHYLSLTPKTDRSNCPITSPPPLSNLMFPAQMTSLHLVSGWMKRQFIHPLTPEPLILLENYLLEWNCPLYSLNKKNIAIQKTHFHYTAKKNKLSDYCKKKKKKNFFCTRCWISYWLYVCLFRKLTSCYLPGNPVGQNRKVPQRDGWRNYPLWNWVPLLPVWRGQSGGSLQTSQSG